VPRGVSADRWTACRQLPDVLPVPRPGDRGHVPREGPAQHDLGRRPAAPYGDRGHGGGRQDGVLELPAPVPAVPVLRPQANSIPSFPHASRSSSAGSIGPEYAGTSRIRGRGATARSKLSLRRYSRRIPIACAAFRCTKDSIVTSPHFALWNARFPGPSATSAQPVVVDCEESIVSKVSGWQAFDDDHHGDCERVCACRSFKIPRISSNLSSRLGFNLRGSPRSSDRLGCPSGLPVWASNPQRKGRVISEHSKRNGRSCSGRRSALKSKWITSNLSSRLGFNSKRISLEICPSGLVLQTTSDPAPWKGHSNARRHSISVEAFSRDKLANAHDPCGIPSLTGFHRDVTILRARKKFAHDPCGIPLLAGFHRDVTVSGREKSLRTIRAVFRSWQDSIVTSRYWGREKSLRTIRAACRCSQVS
jgi:hypothetical protein